MSSRARQQSPLSSPPIPPHHTRPSCDPPCAGYYRCADSRVIVYQVVVVLDPAEDEEDYLRINRTREKQYAFDTVFDHTCSNKVKRPQI